MSRLLLYIFLTVSSSVTLGDQELPIKDSNSLVHDRKLHTSEQVVDSEKIEAIRADSNTAIARRDVLGIVSSLASEYQITVGTGVLYQGGPEEEAVAWAATFAERKDVVYVRTPVTIEVSSYLPRAIEHGHWVGSWIASGGHKEVGGSYTASWSMRKEEWKIRSEIYVTLYCNGPGC